MAVDFGPKIRRLRLVRGLTLEAMAKKMGMEKAAMADMETWDGHPPLDIVTKAARILNVAEVTLVIPCPHAFEQIVLLACSQQLELDALKSFTAGMEELVQALQPVKPENEKEGII